MDTSQEALGVRWMCCEGAAVGSEGVCLSQELLILQMVALEQNWHLQTLDTKLSKQGHGITFDKWNCHPLSLWRRKPNIFSHFWEPIELCEGFLFSRYTT